MNETADLHLSPARERAPKRRIAGIGRVLLWHGASLWIGRDAGQVDAHAHHAIQVALAMDAAFRMAEGDDGDWRDHAGAIVLPHRRHRFDGARGRVAMLFVEPEAPQGRALLRRVAGGADAIVAIDGATAETLVAPLRQAYLAGASDEALVDAAVAAIDALAGPVPSEAAVDPRVSRAIAWLRSSLDRPVTLADAAAVAHLSASRFRHLFVAQTGVSFRAYLLWARVQAAVSAAMHGQSWTTAAHAAGFADAAHLSRTCRQMFGIAPATLLDERTAPAAERSAGAAEPTAGAQRNALR